MVYSVDSMGEFITGSSRWREDSVKSANVNRRLNELLLPISDKDAFEQKIKKSHVTRSLLYFSARLNNVSLKSKIFGYSRHDAKAAINFLESICFLWASKNGWGLDTCSGSTAIRLLENLLEQVNYDSENSKVRRHYDVKKIANTIKNMLVSYPGYWEKPLDCVEVQAWGKTIKVALQILKQKNKLSSGNPFCCISMDRTSENAYRHLDS